MSSEIDLEVDKGLKCDLLIRGMAAPVPEPEPEFLELLGEVVARDAMTESEFVEAQRQGLGQALGQDYLKLFSK